LLFSLVVIPFVAVESQAPAPAGFEHWTTADLQGLNKMLGEKAAGDAHYMRRRRHLWTIKMIYSCWRTGRADGQVELHETQADVFSWSRVGGRLVVGGTSEGRETTAPPRETQRHD